ncbi:MAG: sugar ABC transporter substrate-binding protein [Chloroflexi bacterium]|nr:sugar ABC transporter substrate-binding protein [Chloroflexota bacterium]
MPQKHLDVAFIGGPQYDALYRRLPQFEQETGYAVNVHVRLPHPALNAHIDEVFAAGTATYDVISTHVKYAPAQQQWLLPLDTHFSEAELADFSPALLKLARVNGALVQIPRNVDARILFYHNDLLESPAEQARFQRQYRRTLRVPQTWDEVRDVATFFTRPPDLFGFAFPGHSSGLFGTFFELVAMAGGTLFDAELNPSFNTAAGRWALGFLADLYQQGLTPRDLTATHFDEVSQLFRDGKCALAADWPAYYGLLTDPQESAVADKFGVALYPVGPAGTRAVYAGGHSFTIPTSVKDLDGALSLVRFLTSAESQYVEAQTGAIVPRSAVMARVRGETPAGTVHAQRLALLEETIQNHMLTFPKFAAYPQVEEVCAETLQAAIRGQVMLPRALEYMEEQVRGLLS